MAQLFLSKTNRGFIFALGALVFLKILITALFPVIGDEAYYFYWGTHPNGGYYDLPPMIGWWLIPFSKIFVSSFWLRLPNLITSGLVTFGIYEWLRERVSSKRASMIAGLFFFLPLPFLAVLMFPDIPLLLFGFYSCLLFYRAARSPSRSGSHLEFMLSGALWGSAFLSKYFAVLFLPAFVIWFLLQKKKSWLSPLCFTVGVFPFLFQHLFWNQNHCWANFVFNLISRQKANYGSAVQTFGLFLVYLFLLGTPILLSQIFKRAQTPLDRGLENAAELKELDRFFLLLWSIPTFLFGLTALLGKGQGIHWLLFVTPYFVMSVGLRTAEAELFLKLKRLMKVSGALAGIVLVALSLPDLVVGPFFKTRLAFDYQLVMHPSSFMKSILPTLSGSEVAFTEGYSLSSVLSHDFREYSSEQNINLPPVSVWGGGSRFGREFDWTTDWKALEGKKITLITPGPIDTHYWSQYFSDLQNVTLQFENQPIYVSVGTGFRSEMYVKQEFKKAVENFYPKFLPGRCSLKDE